MKQPMITMFFCFLLAALASPTQAWGRSLNQATSAGPTSACPLDPDTTSIDLSEVKTSCVAPPQGAALTSAQCDQCSCALFSAFSPAFVQLGLFNSSSASSAGGNNTEAIEQGISAITACVTDFLPAFVNEKVDIQALVALGNCTYGDGEVPTCLVQRVQALTTTGSTTTPSTNSTTTTPSEEIVLPGATGTAPAPSSSSTPDVNASAGPSDYTPDTNINKDVQGAISNPGGTTAPVPASAPASTTPAAEPASATPAPAPVPSPVPLSASKILPSGLLAAALLLATIVF